MTNTERKPAINTRLYQTASIGGIIASVIMGIVAMVLGRVISGLTGNPQPNVLLEIASIVKSNSPAVGFGLHLLIGAILGVGFAVLVGNRLNSRNAIITSSTVYGIAWTLFGTLISLPILSGAGLEGVAAAFARALTPAIIPSLVSHAVFGLILGLIYARVVVRNQT
jgi:hypothetical protein